MMVVALIFTAGCGDSQRDFVFTNSGTSPTQAADTGSLTFNFTRAQTSSEVPRETQRLRFQFLDSRENVVLLREVAFAAQVTINEVPLTAVSVRITALAGGQFPLAVLNDTVSELRAGTTQVVNLADATARAVTFDSLAVTPKPVTLQVGGSQTLAVSASFSNGERVTVPNSTAGLQFTTVDGNIAGVSAGGVVTGAGPGSTTVTAAWTFNGVTRNDQTSVSVGGVGFTIGLVSVDSDGVQGNDHSNAASISADGRYVAFFSGASNLVAEDVNGTWDVFVHDRQTGVTTLVSVDSDGTQGDDSSFSPSISADGRFVAFQSFASNLVAGDTNGYVDVFVHDRQTGVTTLVSVDSDGTQGDDSSFSPSISADGRYVAFESGASNLVAGDVNGTYDVFVHDLQTGVTTLVSVESDGVQGNSDSGTSSISADGRYVAFSSYASNLVAGDTNGYVDVFVHDRQTGVTTLVSVSVDSDGVQGNDHSNAASISADGRYVAFFSGASNLVAGDLNGTYDVFVHDLQTGVTTLVSVDSDGVQGNGYSDAPSISADGRYVAFPSEASNLVAGDLNGTYDVFVHDLQTGVTTLVSVDSDGAQGNSYSGGRSISGDGRFVAFDSFASNLVVGDINDAYDVFVARNILAP